VTGLDLIWGRFSRAPKLHGFFFEACVSMLQQITHWNCFRAALDAQGSFSSLVLVNWDRLIFFDPDA